MESNKILEADILDIIFEGKNKEYGAYQLRKTYNRRLTKAMLGMGVLLAFLLGGYFLSGLHAAPGNRPVVGPDDSLSEIVTKKDDPIIVPPKPVPIQIKTKQFTSIIQIVKEVKPEERPPEQADIVDTKIGTINQGGIKDEGITAPPSDGDRGVVAAPQKTENDDLPFMAVEKDAEYPGGMTAWKRYMDRNFRYPDDGFNIGVEGVVVVQFVVDKDGNVSDVHAISGPDNGGLREEAVRVIKKSGKWIPALQNGTFVKAYRKQPVVFKIGTE
jgi:protein TonB